MNDIKKQKLDLDETREGVLAIVNENKYTAVGSGLLASLGAFFGGPIGAVVGGGIGGLVGNVLDRRSDTVIDITPQTDNGEEDLT